MKFIEGSGMNQCKYQVYSAYSFQGTKRCSRNAVDGAEFCKIHQPETIKARQEAKHKRWDANHEASMKRYRLAAASSDLLAVCKEAKVQIEYLHEKFAVTGSGNTVLARLVAAINKAERG